MPERRRIRVTGTVQGVGFRPFVYREATTLGLAGFVRNDSAGVLIEVQGPSDAVAELCRRLTACPPPLARVDTVTTAVVAMDPATRAFAIDATIARGAPDVPVSVDTATCVDCLAEVFDPDNRRFRYAFTNCTNCGPRYTIVRSVPYDRPATTMAGFPMCAACRQEYDDPADRRFHAQPNACPMCGPRLRYLDAGGGEPDPSAEPLRLAVTALRSGAVLAVKGLGGYHLAADATDAAAVTALRQRKQRDDKPFALMVGDVAAARALVELDDGAAAMLASPRRPIILARRRADAAVAAAVAPGLPELGVMLAYTPLHHLLTADLAAPLVLTSGNLSDEPIAFLDDDAVARLGPLVDAILTHDRPIHIRCDDSVVRAGPASTQMLRRSRGFAPEPLELPFAAHRAVLAVGAELKSTVAVAKGRIVIPSHHIGDLEHLAAYQAFCQAVDHLRQLSGIAPAVVAHDLHPEYLSTKFAADLDLPLVGVQHHHAHIASCLVDHGREAPVLALAFDGHGYGPDGTLWGGEFLVADFDTSRRVGHLLPVPLVSGSAAIREPWRMATIWMRAAGGADLARAIGTRLDDRAPALLDVPTGVVTTSVGRLFDAAAALVLSRTRATYEGQAAIELEALAASIPIGHAPVVALDATMDGDRLVLDPSNVLLALVDAEPGPLAAAMFHESIGRAAVDAATVLARRSGLETVALTGGVFQNARLSAIVASGLADNGLEVLTHRRVPPNDGGISIGQAAIAAHSS